MATRREFHKGVLAAAFAAIARPVSASNSPTNTARLFLNRLTFGASPQDLERFEAMSLTGWLDEQLTKPAEDQALIDRLARAQLLIEYEDGATGEGVPWTALSEMRPYQYLNEDPKNLLKFLDFSQGIAWQERVRPTKEVISASSMRAVHAEAQLREVITQFWHEHFSVNALKDESTAIFFPQYDRSLRANALGNFRELLGIVAKSPVMLSYLNNDASRASPANENYARELLELHTLGAMHYFNDLYDDWKAVPGATEGQAEGYIDQDVYEVARAFTGWSIGDGRWVDEGSYAPKSGQFEYFENWHDPYQKRILGIEFRPNAAKMEDGERVLDILSTHPGTAKFVTGKLLKRLGIEMPSEGYHREIADVFLNQASAPDQIAKVVRAIVLHPEFAATPASKLKRPYEFLIGMYRATGADLASPRYNVHWWLERTGWTQHQVRPPTGHSDASVDWANTRAINGMVDLAVYGHDDWFEVGNLDLSIAHNGATTWLELAEFWALRFGVDESQTRPIIAAMEETPDNPLPEDPDYLMWANKTAITLSALTSEFLFR